MSRTELVEIIFALKQSEDQLKAENAALTAKLEDRQLHIQNAGSIAQAALELNRVFEAAQTAADEYLASVRAAGPELAAAPQSPDAGLQLAQAQAEAEALKRRTAEECEAMLAEAERKRDRTEADCKAMVAKAQQEVQARWAEFDRRASEVLDRYQNTDFLPEDRHTT